MSWKDFHQITEQLTDALDRTPRDEASILAALDTLCATGDARVLVPLVAVLWPCFERQSARTILGKLYVKFRLTDLQISPGLRDEAAMRLVKFLAHFPVYRLREIDHTIRRAGRDHWAALLREARWTCWVKAPEPGRNWR